MMHDDEEVEGEDELIDGGADEEFDGEEGSADAE